MVLIVIILVSLFSFLLTYIIQSLAVRFRLINYPTDRSLHTEKTPRGGGLAIVITWYFGLVSFYILDIVDQELFYAMVCGIVLAIVSFVDDIVEIKPIIRLIIHFGVSIAAFYFLGGLRKPITLGVDYLSSPILIYPLAIIGMVWFINLYNFMDGADGFASLEAIIISLVLFYFTNSWIVLVLAAAVLGFLFLNWPKAKIFMGDVGSTQLGFILVVLGIHYHNTLDFSIFNWLMISAPFWFDATLTLYRRWRNKENLGQPHKKHVYQRFIQAGFSHLQLDYALIVINIIIFCLIMVYREFDYMKIPIYLFTLGFLYYLTKRIDKVFPFN